MGLEPIIFFLFLVEACFCYINEKEESKLLQSSVPTVFEEDCSWESLRLFYYEVWGPEGVGMCLLATTPFA